MNSGSFPRDLDNILPDEVCVDWEAEGSPCPDFFKYEGYQSPEIKLLKFDTKYGIWTRGLSDYMCMGVLKHELYEGMEIFELSDWLASFTSEIFLDQ